MWDFLSKLFDSDFMPHGYCYLWQPGVLWSHAVSDILIALSYFSIPAALIYFVRRRRDLPFDWMFLMFGLFIFGCGMTHVMEVWTLWIPQYRLAGLVKVVTALFSVSTALLLIPTVPKALAIPSPEDLRRALDEKKVEVAERERAEASLRSLSARLLHVQDNEHRKIARELHDGVGQNLSALRLNLEAVDRVSGSLERTQREAITESLRLADIALKEIRTISYLLHPQELDMIGVASAIRSYVRGFGERSGIHVELDFPADIGRLDPEVELTMFRIVQESLTNIHRHSGSVSARVGLSTSQGKLILKASDKGKGLPSKLMAATHGGVGIVGMVERVTELGGSLEIKSDTGGATVLATMTLNRTAAPPLSARAVRSSG